MTAFRTFPERFTRLTIIVSLLAAIWMQASDIGLRAAAATAFIVAWTAGRLRPGWTRRAALFTTYILPAYFVSTRERFAEVHSVLWVALLCGVIFSAPSLLRWSLPGRWKLPLAFWCVLAAVTWPVVTLREVDFYLAQWQLSNGWAATVAMGIMVGILWFDWLFSMYGPANETAFDTEILLPLALGWMVAASVGVYQMFVQMTFLNPGLWAALERATGLLGDSNVFALISAMWGPALVAVTFRRPTRWAGWWLGAIGLSLSWLAIWGSGSRSSLPIALLGFVGVLIGLYRSTGSNRLLWVTAFAIPVAGAFALAVMQGLSRETPIFRVLKEFGEPQWSVEWARGVLTDLWTRNGFGTVAVNLIRQFPLVGVGLSAFYYLAAIFSRGVTDPPLPFDNAQNWYRHELTELGFIGSLGWIVWTVSFLFLLVTARSRPGRQLTATVLRLVLAGFGVISLVGMPAQSLIVAFTFWTLAFWFTRETATPLPTDSRGSQPSTIAWVVLWVVVLGHTAGTAYVGWTTLRPPVRALRAELNYSLGFYLPEGDGSDAFRWAKQRAVAVMPAPKAWMEITVKVNHLDLARNPVDARVWIDGASILRTRLRTVDPVTRYVRVPAGKRIMIETWVSRLHTDETGPPDRRERGLLVRWNFVDVPPAGATIAGE
ncbi:MAG TPA: hypothetical protein VGJ39_12860 [Vicinamibacterales bacterium]